MLLRFLEFFSYILWRASEQSITEVQNVAEQIHRGFSGVYSKVVTNRGNAANLYRAQTAYICNMLAE